MAKISKTVVALSWVSLFTDMGSEMLYPIMPLYLKSIGFSILLIGILEGIVEALAGLSKGYFGGWSDHTGKRLPFVQFGYTLSAISKPLMALSTLPIWVFFSRSADRLGKGIRTAARDAMLADESTAETRGKIFGFHRSMDTVGAFMGPLIALIFLGFYPNQYRWLFVLAFVPGMLAIVSTFFIQEKPVHIKNKKTPSFWGFISYRKNASPSYRKATLALILFAIFNSSDVFLLLKIKEAGFSDIWILGIYIFYNFIFAVLAYPIGKMADKMGIYSMLITGIFIFILVYFGMAFSQNILGFVVLFFLYGVYAACTDGMSKALIANHCNADEKASAIGSFVSFQSLATMVAGFVTGYIWYARGSCAALVVSAAGATLVLFLMLGFKTSIVTGHAGRVS
ncbi:MAG: MFS transporter [Bacteroidia bacterium]|nr:MFS transporter [Bacteroidia bacterium]